jgi:hypothetical protein
MHGVICENPFSSKLPERRPHSGPLLGAGFIFKYPLFGTCVRGPKLLLLPLFVCKNQSSFVWGNFLGSCPVLCSIVSGHAGPCSGGRSPVLFRPVRALRSPVRPPILCMSPWSKSHRSTSNNTTQNHLRTRRKCSTEISVNLR